MNLIYIMNNYIVLHPVETRYLTTKRNFSLGRNIYIFRKKNTGRVRLRKLNPVREKDMPGHANSAVSCLVVTTRHSFRSWDSEIWPLAKFRSSMNSRRRACWVLASRTTIHPRYVGIRIHGETYIRAGNNSKRKAGGCAIVSCAIFPGDAKWMNV